MISEKINNVNTSQTMKISSEVKKLAGEGADIIDLSIGEPDFPTPDNIKNAAISAIKNNFTRYTLNAGTADLRKAISEKLRKENGLDYSLNEIVVSTGAKQSIFNAIHVITDPGNEIIIPSPYWVSYPEMVKLAHGTPVIINTTDKNEFKLQPDDLENAVSKKTKALVLCNPSNPTGVVYKKEELETIAEICKKHNIYVISDEIYEKLIYDENKFISFASLPGMRERTVIVNGVSKSYAMTGWRIGYSAGPEDFIRAIDKIQSHSTSNASSISQAAALEALNGPQTYIEIMKAEFEKRRDYLYKEISSIDGIQCVKPHGAFYIFPDVSLLFGRKTEVMRITDAFDLSMYLLYKAGVAVVPGDVFGSPGHIRISYSTSLEKLSAAVERVKAALEKLN